MSRFPNNTFDLNRITPNNIIPIARKVASNPKFTPPSSPLADGLPLIAFFCSDKFVITKKDHEKIQNAIAVYSRIETPSTKKIAGRECKAGPLSKPGRAIEREEKHRK